MKKSFLFSVVVILLSFLTVQAAKGQNGIIKGNIKDKSTGEPLFGVNVFIPNTSMGASTDFDGNFSFEVPAGTYQLKMTLIGYKEINQSGIVVKAGQTVTMNELMGEDSEMLGEVKVVATARKESQTALIAEQKKSTVIKESVGAEQLSSQGVSNAAAATSKISGVSKTEGSGDVFVRGLGDRYLSTTMNGLPIPSDNVDKKNIDLSVFGTNVIQNVSITKTYDAADYIDQASGNIDILSKGFKGKFSVSLNAGINSNILKDNVWNNFKVTSNSEDLTFGFYSRPYSLKESMTKQSWNPVVKNMPLDRKFSTTGGFRFGENSPISVFYTLSHSNSFQHTKGTYKKYRSNILKRKFLDAESFSYKTNTTGLLNLKYNVVSGHILKYNTLFINKSSDNLYEQGRNQKGYGYDIEGVEDSFFIRDQNIKIIQLWVNQLLGRHNLGENNDLKWAVGYNIVDASEPCRIRNTTGFSSKGIMIFPPSIGDYGNGKSSQDIADTEINGYIKDEIGLPSLGEEFNLSFGFSFRNKKRDFKSNFYGASISDFKTPSVDDLSAIFTSGKLDENRIKTLPKDRYDASLSVYGIFTNFSFGLGEDFSGTVGVRYEIDKVDIDWNVGNYFNQETGRTRIGNLVRNYKSVYPALNLKYTLKEDMFLRFAASKTITLPEFKEMSPFEYMAPTGRVTKGNEKLQKSDNYNFDLKWEYYLTSEELFSITSFYKYIKNPINARAPRGGSEAYYFENTGKESTVFGIELETRLNLLKTDDYHLKFNLNATKMWSCQDLLEDFYYKDKKTAGLQGASDFILNGLLKYESLKHKFMFATSLNYSSDKIFSLGAPTDGADRATIYDDDIVEKGFVSLDAVFSKKITDKFSLKLTAKNLLNPELKRVQNVLSNGIETTETVRSYKKGMKISLGLKYIF